MVYDTTINNDIKYIVEQLGENVTRLAGKTVLITGANGFLPAYLVDTINTLNCTRLKNTPIKLICMTLEPKEQCSRIAHVLNSPHIELIQQDVGKKFSLQKKIDFIIHAASKASPRDYLADPIGTIDANVNGTRQLLEYAAENNVESFLFFSSSEIYGSVDSSQYPLAENCLGLSDWLAPRSCYTEAKRFSETLCANFFYQYNVPVKIVRPSQIFGPGLRLHDGRVIADFLNDGLHNKDITILSDGTARRSFCYVSDATIAFWLILLNGKNGEAYNVGNSTEEVSIKELAQIVANIFDNKITVNIQNTAKKTYLKDSPSRSSVSTVKLQQEFNFTPSTSLTEGLIKLKTWYQQQLNLSTTKTQEYTSNANQQ